MDNKVVSSPNCPSCGGALPYFDAMKSASAPKRCLICNSAYRREIKFGFVLFSFFLMYMVAFIPGGIFFKVVSLFLAAILISVVEWKAFIRIRHLS